MNNERLRVATGECFVTYEPVKSSSGMDAAANGQSDENSHPRALHEDDVDDSSRSASGDSGNDGSRVSSNGEKVKKESKKKDRSKLRKGKWTVEEEEYTSRIIHYFSTGLLSLPEGATLRSYLAEKLNCDPMRITKKYAGASCLGRRVYNFRDRPHPTIAEIQLAKAELDLLEQRFRKRIEDGHSSMPLPSPSLIANFVQSAMPALANGNAFNPWLSALSAASSAGLTAPAPPPSNLLASTWTQTPAPAPLPWLLPNPQAAAPAPTSSVPSNNSILQFNAQGFESVMKSIAFAQAAASLAPAVSQLAVANFQRNQQQLAEETQAELIASRLRQVYEEQFAKAQAMPNPPIVPSSKLPSILPTPATAISVEMAAKGKSPSVVPSQQPTKHEQRNNTSNSKPRTEEDKAAGSILLGFLSSLRQSYEEALQEKQNVLQQEDDGRNTKTDSDSSDSFSGDPTRLASATVTDLSSPPTESPVEDSDWNSDKKTDPSSSEDSDKESSKGPPRKRLKKMAAECMKHLGSN